MNEDGDSVKEVFDVFGTMLVTAFEMLSEHNLIREDSPIPNVGIVTLLVIDFLEGTCNDFDMEGVCEIVRAADKFGVKLVPREEVSGVGQGDIDLLRQEYEEAGEEEVKKFDWKSDVSRP